MRHFYNYGLLKNCQICGSANIKEVFHLGFQPLADDLSNEVFKNTVKNYFPIKIDFCKKCRLLQNSYIVGDSILYNKSYHYRPGISKSIVDNLYILARDILKIYKPSINDYILDVGCNDGTLLNQFKKLGFSKLIGVDPTNTIKIIKNKNIKTFNYFFDLNTAKRIKKIHGKIKIITTTNVFAHTNNLGAFILGVKELIKNDGVFIIENHYLLDVIKKNQFDTFYHEHLRTYSLKSLILLMKMYGFKIIDAYRSERYGGNIQAHFVLNHSQLKRSKNISVILKKEMFLDNISTYFKFKKRIDKIKYALLEFLIKNKNKVIIGKAFPARASVILHYFSYLKDFISVIAEQPSSLKINYYAPGTNIKIVNSNGLIKIKPRIIIIFAWHLFSVIKKKWISRGLKNVKFVKVLPKLKIF